MEINSSALTSDLGKATPIALAGDQPILQSSVDDLSSPSLLPENPEKLTNNVNDLPSTINIPTESKRINVLDKNNKLVSIPFDQVENAVIKDKVFTLAPKPLLNPSANELKAGRVNLYVNGELKSIPLDQVEDILKPVNAGGLGAMTPEQYKRSQEPIVQKNLQLLNTFYGTPLKDRAPIGQEITLFHDHDDLQDQDGNYKMSKDGQNISVPLNQMAQFQQAGWTFSDRNAQAMYDANLINNKTNTHLSQQAQSFVSGSDSILPDFMNFTKIGLSRNNPDPNSFLSILGGVFTSTPMNNAQRLTDLAGESPELQENYQGARTLGKAAGLAATLINPGGIIGEGFAAERLGAGAAKLAEATGLGKLGTLAAEGAGKGLGYALPYAADQLINNDPGKAAETTLLSMGIGSILHVAPSAFNSIIGARASAAASELPGAAQNVLDKAGVNLGEVAPDVKTNFVRNLVADNGGKLLDTESSLKSLAAGDHLAPTLSNLGSKVTADTDPIVSKLSELGFNGKASDEVNESLKKIIHAVQDDAVNRSVSNPSIPLSDLQKVSKDIINSIDFKSTGISDILDTKLNALHILNSSMLEAGDSAITRAVEAGDSRVAKLASNWENGKQIQALAQSALSDFSGEIAAGSTPELTNLGKIAKNIYTQAGSNLKAKFSTNPVLAAAEFIPGLGRIAKAGSMLTGAPTKFVEATQKVIEGRSSSFTDFLASHPNSWLIKNASNPAIATFTALDAIASNNAKLAEIPNFIKNGAIRVPSIFIAQNDPIKNILGTEANGLSKEQQLTRLSEKVSMLAGNPTVAQSRVNDLIQPFTTDHPQMASAAQNLAQQKIAYLHQMLHGNNSTEPKPFQADNSVDKQYTPAEVKSIHNQLAAIQNPYILLSGLAPEHQITPEQVKAVQATSPAIYQQIKQSVLNSAYNGKTKLNYQQRLAASMITGQPMDKTLSMTPQIQSVFNPPSGSSSQQQQPVAKNGKVSHSHTSHKLDSENLPSHQTVGQRVANS